MDTGTSTPSSAAAAVGFLLLCARLSLLQRVSDTNRCASSTDEEQLGRELSQTRWHGIAKT